MSEARPPVGAPMPRVEDRPFVEGNARYLDDLQIPGVLSVAFVRCPLGHARVRNLSFERARGMPGFVAAFGPQDLPALGKPMPGMGGEGTHERTPAALTDEPRYAGDAVAVVVAEDAYQAADIAAAVEVSYAELPVVTDPIAALRDGAPLVHADVPGNVLAFLPARMGDVDAAFRQADVIVRAHLHTRRASNASMEPRGVAAQPGGAEEGVVLTVWSSTQSPHNVGRTITQALGLQPAQVRLVTPCVGGGFGPKGRSYPEEVAVAALAMHLGRPCRWEAARREDFLSTAQGHGLRTEAELAARFDGTILGLRARMVQDGGAYTIGPPRPAIHAVEHLLGPYHVPAADVEVTTAYTNKAWLTPLRGGGREQGVFVIERLLDHLARRLGLDPLEVRRRNVVGAGEFPYDTRYPKAEGGTVIYDSGDYPAYLEEARKFTGYDEIRRAQPAERQAGKYRGVAVSMFVEGTGVGQEGARVEVRDDGTVRLTLGSPDTGQGHPTSMYQVAAAELGVPPASVTFESGDTKAMSVGFGTFASRFAVMAGNATALAARQVRQRALVVAGALLGVMPPGLEIKDGVVRSKKAPERSCSLAELVPRARQAGIPLDVTHVFAPERATTWTGGACAAVVEVDVETGEVKVERIVVVHDSGKIINPLITEGQVQGAVTMGIGEALGEMMAYGEDGKLLTDSFMTYVVPRAEHVPPIAVQEHPCYSPNNPEGIKGAGETGLIGTLPAIAGAVEDALAPLDVQIDELPVRAEDLARLCAPLRSRVEAHDGRPT